ncbi:Heavy metal-associated isoprenylated plant protein 3, partial [Cucurbita argyrosperma subsp. sororia]
MCSMHSYLSIKQVLMQHKLISCTIVCVQAVQNKKKNHNEKNGDGGGGGGGGGKKKEDNPFTVVLKVDMHCEGCANKIIKCVKGFEGVQSVKAEFEGNKLTVIGKKIDASKLREKLSNKTKKKVDLISPQPKKERTRNRKKTTAATTTATRPSPPPVTTAVLKVTLHCQGCIEKIQRATSKFKGRRLTNSSVNKRRGLKKRSVEIVPTKNKNNSDNNNDDTLAKDIDKNNTEGGSNSNGTQMEYMGMGIGGIGYEYGHWVGVGIGYGYGYDASEVVGENLHAPQMFSDENPNACSIM